MLTITNGGGPLLVVAGVVLVAVMTIAKPGPDETAERTQQLAGPRGLVVAITAGAFALVALAVTVGTLTNLH